jgi:rhodanese-related sulfurtransferase
VNIRNRPCEVSTTASPEMADKSGAELISEARKRIKEISVADVLAMQARGDNAVYLDVREQNEWNLGHIPKATFLPRGVIETTVEQRVPRDAKVIIYCASGNRSVLAAETMHHMGYHDVASMAGGIRKWVESGGDVEG